MQIVALPAREITQFDSHDVLMTLATALPGSVGAAWEVGAVEFNRYLDLLRADARRLTSVALRGLDAPVPSCPGWTVDDVVRHVSLVYLHKIECMRLQASPDPWPPDLSHREPIALMEGALDELVEELDHRGPAALSYTWYGPDQTVGFWYRRMAQETAVHRVDVEQAHEVITPIDTELATDGIDEVLTIMLAGDWSDEPVDDAAGGSVRVDAGGRTWRIGLDRTEVTCDAGAGHSAGATVAGEPSDMLLWLWGRAPIDRLTVGGDRDTVTALRHRLAMATQ